MRRYEIPAVFLIMASCAAPMNESTLDRRVTRVEGAAAPSEPRVDAVAPGPEWMVQRDVPVEGSPNAPILLMQPEPDAKAMVFVVLFPSEIGPPKEFARQQRDALIKLGVVCSEVSASEDGKRASFTVTMRPNADGVSRAGKITYLLRDGRKDWTAALFGSWEKESDKAMLEEMAEIEASVTVR